MDPRKERPSAPPPTAAPTSLRADPSGDIATLVRAGDVDTLERRFRELERRQALEVRRRERISTCCRILVVVLFLVVGMVVLVVAKTLLEYQALRERAMEDPLFPR